jgi:hypothetical protein
MTTEPASVTAMRQLVAEARERSGGPQRRRPAAVPRPEPEDQERPDRR